MVLNYRNVLTQTMDARLSFQSCRRTHEGHMGMENCKRVCLLFCFLLVHIQNAEKKHIRLDPVFLRPTLNCVCTHRYQPSKYARDLKDSCFSPWKNNKIFEKCLIS